MQFKLKKIRSDASFREFFRLHKGKKTSIIVTAKKERFKNLIAYSAINKFLKTKGIYTPRLISQHFKEGSGRRELAEAIVAPGNPLTSRVMVNRLWGEIFGVPLVRSASNFGSTGERPSHPELLDYLAIKFREEVHQSEQEILPTRDVAVLGVAKPGHAISSAPSA